MLYLFNCCLDVNECTLNNGNCDQTCVNKDGSYECKCNDGFSLGDDGKSCAGIISNTLRNEIMARFCHFPPIISQQCSNVTIITMFCGRFFKKKIRLQRL